MSIHTQLTREDAFELLELGKLLHKESRYNNTPYNAESIWNLLDLTLTQPDRFHITYCKKDNVIVAFFLGTVNTEYFTGRKIAVDMGMYVTPSLRGGSQFYKMLKSFESWAEINGANKIVLYHSTGIDPEKSKTLFPRLGYEHYGYIFDKEIK